ncbi:beta-carotene 15,15'-monooxygenase, Brp/Blh family [Methylobacterium sp. 174MFSha1.1]|uniref:Brp/Blh family beta-carotene 15,15'-dioxygenase n=1 Tax=Methylobacterium sp. 174MFSha1.1 TaxID=1502749 RepID=UPI0008E4465F|nr:Brp/Blh family beta-carotene 15,15'-dioxygenase [Methylobacterium sp. 174MFSha1.1]SFU94690.1 beta-carotene 15,15'-monooxygenase, Brp/Blh family [Methylobacterium sp. 174MFSha1.1]
MARRPIPIPAPAGARMLDDATATLPRGAAACLIPAASLLLAATALMPRETGWAMVLALVIGLGVPHGALDGEVAKPFLAPRFGRAWFLVFAAPYLALTAAVLIVWRLAPDLTLAAFLGLSVLHFGREDAGPGRPVEALVRGGLPIALPALMQPGETARIFAVVTSTAMPVLPGWWTVVAWAWLGLALAWLVLRRPPPGLLAELAALSLAFRVLPPLSAFGLYFVCLHAPRHMRALAADPVRAPAVDGMGRAVVLALPVFGLTLLIGLLLWPTYPQADGTERLLALTLQLLAALTLPHLLLDRWVEGRA